jgi:hypothetical protein
VCVCVTGGQRVGGGSSVAGGFKANFGTSGVKG